MTRQCVLHHTSCENKSKRIENIRCVSHDVWYTNSMTTNNSTQAELIAAAAKHAALVNKVQGWAFIAVVLAFCALSFVVVR